MSKAPHNVLVQLLETKESDEVDYHTHEVDADASWPLFLFT